MLCFCILEEFIMVPNFKYTQLFISIAIDHPYYPGTNFHRQLKMGSVFKNLTALKVAREDTIHGSGFEDYELYSSNH